MKRVLVTGVLALSATLSATGAHAQPVNNCMKDEAIQGLIMAKQSESIVYMGQINRLQKELDEKNVQIKQLLELVAKR